MKFQRKELHEIEHLLWISNSLSKYLTCEFKVIMAKQFSHKITARTELISYIWNSLDNRGMQFHVYVTGILLWSVSISNCKNIQTLYMTRLLLFLKVESNGRGPFFKVVLECWKTWTWTFSYLYLWLTMWFLAEKLLKTLKFWQSLNLLYKSGSQPQKSTKISPKITIHSSL